MRGRRHGGAALIGNIVASIIVQQIGVTGTASREQVKDRFLQHINLM